MRSSDSEEGGRSTGVNVIGLAVGLALGLALGFLKNLTTANASCPARTTPRTTPTAIRPLSVLVKAGQGADDLDIGVVASKFCSASEKLISS
jgi:hypothetical protein